MSSLIPSSPEAHASYALYGELDVLLDITKTVLDRTHHAHRFSFGREARDTLESFSVHERARLANSGRLYLHLGVATLFRQRVSSVVEQVILEAIITETIHIFTTSQNRHPTLCVQLGMMAVLQGYDEIYRLLKSALCHDLLAKIALATRHFPERVGAPVVPADRLHKILIRLRDHTNGQIVGPEQLSDLRPVRAPGTPPSNRLLSEACPFRSLLLAHPQRAAFLQAVVRAEILSDGTPLFLLPPMEVSAWNTVLESTEKRRMQLSLCEPVIKTFVSEVVLENMDFDSFDETEYKTILHVVTSDLTLLYLLFRMGVYQEIPECPFDGMTASYPATALRFYFSALHRTSHERNDEVTTAVLGCFGNLVKVVSEASAFFISKYDCGECSNVNARCSQWCAVKPSTKGLGRHTSWCDFRGDADVERQSSDHGVSFAPASGQNGRADNPLCTRYQANPDQLKLPPTLFWVKRPLTLFNNDSQPK